MRAQGWIDEVSGKDGRTTLLSVTTAGSKLLERAFPAWQQAQAQARALLGEQAVTSFSRAAKAVQARGIT
jgi:DNA-binding MarR family transcriptional regulator